VVTPEQEVWAARVARRFHHAILRDPVAREFGAELRRAAADEPREQAVERMRDVLDRLGEHLGLGPRP
jgi:hypothetical protein